MFVCLTFCPGLLAEYLGNHSHLGCPTLTSRRFQFNGAKKEEKNCVQAQELLVALALVTRKLSLLALLANIRKLTS